MLTHRYYNSFLVYCRELAPGIVSLTGDRAQGDDSKHDSHYSISCLTLQLRLLAPKEPDLQQTIYLKRNISFGPRREKTWRRVYIHCIFMLNSTEHEYHHAHKC